MILLNVCKYTFIYAYIHICDNQHLFSFQFSCLSKNSTNKLLSHAQSLHKSFTLGHCSGNNFTLVLKHLQMFHLCDFKIWHSRYLCKKPLSAIFFINYTFFVWKSCSLISFPNDMVQKCVSSLLVKIYKGIIKKKLWKKIRQTKLFLLVHRLSSLLLSKVGIFKNSSDITRQETLWEDEDTIWHQHSSHLWNTRHTFNIKEYLSII